jgi:hypothetical protein
MLPIDVGMEITLGAVIVENKNWNWEHTLLPVENRILVYGANSRALSCHNEPSLRMLKAEDWAMPI